ncbi:MAG: hypothetical protein IJ814_02800 [Paludibacteraceae bacterium]|nr:hypothetical protein [Paludibacteraceae bacterium]
MSKNTNHSAHTADSFEQQLAASARRLRDSQAANLPVPALHPLRRHYWGWVATPAAAAAGLLIGLFINRPAPTPDRFSPHAGHTSFTVPVVTAGTTGHSILDDGTDYSLLVKM